MIELKDIHKRYPVRGGSVEILKGVNLRVERGQRMGILGGNGAGKSTLLRLISRIERPTSGSITCSMRMSWPIAFSGAFQGALTGLDNMRCICRIYGIDPADVIDFVEDFSQLGRYLREPVRFYSSGMRARLAFAVSMMIDFDCYLIDEVVMVGDSRFRDRCNEELFEKRADRSLIIVSHDSHYLREHCELGSVLSGGHLLHFDTVEEALAAHDRNMHS
jgi:capsular polysaccharide transport system ATP-binding protein